MHEMASENKSMIIIMFNIFRVQINILIWSNALHNSRGNNCVQLSPSSHKNSFNNTGSSRLQNVYATMDFNSKKHRNLLKHNSKGILPETKQTFLTFNFIVHAIIDNIRGRNKFRENVVQNNDNHAWYSLKTFEITWIWQYYDKQNKIHSSSNSTGSKLQKQSSALDLGEELFLWLVSVGHYLTED